jgi:hypothetical protein
MDTCDVHHGDCVIYYYPGQIILEGSEQEIHSEAYRILRRFAFSAAPYQVVEDYGDHMVLAQLN